MARSLKSNGPGHNSGAVPEKPYFDRLVAIETHMKELREDRKQICIEAKEADIFIGALKHRVKRHMESEEARLARETMEAESDRIGRALGEFANLPLGQAAMERAGAENTDL
jgi:hypothetical protein